MVQQTNNLTLVHQFQLSELRVDGDLKRAVARGNDPSVVLPHPARLSVTPRVTTMPASSNVTCFPT